MKNSPQNNHYRWIWIYAAVIVLLAGAINILMWLPIPTFGSLSETSWLGFWGSYLGGALGCAPAIAALYESKRQAQQQHEEVQEQLEESRKQAAIQLEESEKDRRLSIRPFMTIEFRNLTSRPTSFDSYLCFLPFGEDSSPKALTSENIAHSFATPVFNKNAHRYFEICLENIGLGPALNVVLHYYKNDSVTLGSLASCTSKRLIIILPELSEKEEVCEFTISYFNTYDERFEYRRTFTYSVSGYRPGDLEPVPNSSSDNPNLS